MAIPKTLLFVVLPLAVFYHLVQSDFDNYQRVIQNVVDAPVAPPPQQIDCDGACAGRCQLSSRPRLCKRACGTCCARCNCVPPGTAGNYDACPCYANMTTHGGRHKCP